MTTSIIMIAKDRRELTAQAIESIYRHSSEAEQSTFNLVVVDDASQVAVSTLVPPRKNMLAVRLSQSKGIVGLARNIGASISKSYWGRGQYLLFLDNDIAIIRPGWLDRFQRGFSLGASIIGGCRHPFHHPNADAVAFEDIMLLPVDAVAGYSMFMSWDIFEKYGPFDANQPGTGASEDFALCQRVIKAGGLAMYLDPPALTHCGLRNTNGAPATGHMEFERVPGILYE